MFKQGSKPDVIKQAEAAIANDEEKHHADSGFSPGNENNEQAAEANEEATKALNEQPKMTDIFSWQHINYTVSASGQNRKLLDDISGYVAPGKLTALMGESGAGKVCSQNSKGLEKSSHLIVRPPCSMF